MIGLAIFVGVILIIVFLANASSGVKRWRASTHRRTHENGLEPDYYFEGRFYVSLREASEAAGDAGMRFIIAVYRRRGFLWMFFDGKDGGPDYQIPFGDISNVRREVYKAGEHGPYTIQVIIAEIDSESFPLRQFILYPGEYKHLDQLKAVMAW